MAEAAVSFALRTLSSLLVQEIKLLGQVRNGVRDIKLELERIRSFLKDADTRAAHEEEGRGRESNEGVKTWVKQVREEAYRIEDAFDEYILKRAKLTHGRGLVRFLHKVYHLKKIQKLRHEIKNEIKNIKSSLAEIHRREQFYSFRNIEQGSSSGTTNVVPHDSTIGSFFLEDHEVVGIESARNELIDLLVNGKSDRSVIAVVGEGGLGKTTLAGKIYNNDTIKKHFDCRAWIIVGKECMKKDLLRTIIQELYRPTGFGLRDIEKMEEMDLINTLKKFLKDKCYMVVLDDVWKTDFWEDVKDALFDNNKSSRVMLTTRDKVVAYSVPFIDVHMLESLPYDKALELFCRKAFGSKLGCPPELEKLSHDVLVKCGGLPLAIVAIGGLLSNKNKIVSEWQNLLDSLGSKLGSDPQLKRCNRVLTEGYYDLPYHLKSCLLYFGLFPESYSIKCSRLIRLWIAEGLFEYQKSPRLEQVAEEYLSDLIDRSLVQVSERKVSGQARRCRVHDLMHEIICKKAKELGFCGVLNGEDLTQCSITRRISINKSADGVLESIKDSKIRSICLFNIDKLPESFTSSFVANFKLIKVLDFQDAPVDYLPDGVGKLFHLHYLSLKNTKVKELPKSIGKLVNLETLDLKWSFVTELPIEIRNLKKLRCLLVRHFDREEPYGGRTKIHEGFGALTDLQKLSFVHANSEVLEVLRKLRELRVLGIRLANKEVKNLFAIVKNLENLEYLGVEAISEIGILDVESVAPPPQCLQRLCLKGNIMKLPNWITELQNLIKIELSLRRSTDDVMRVLQALPNLLQLYLRVTVSAEQLRFENGWFLKLKELFLCDFKRLKLLMIDNGALPNLRKLLIGPSPLKEIPIGIEHLRNLKILTFRLMLKEIYHMMKEENWEKVTNRIPEIHVSIKETYKSYFTYTTKYLSSMSPDDIKKLIEEYSQTKSKFGPARL